MTEHRLNFSEKYQLNKPTEKSSDKINLRPTHTLSLAITVCHMEELDNTQMA